MIFFTDCNLCVLNVTFEVNCERYFPVFNQTKKKDIGWFHPLKKKKRKNKVILTDTIRDVLKCFIPEKKYGPLLVNKKLRSLFSIKYMLFSFIQLLSGILHVVS